MSDIYVAPKPRAAISLSIVLAWVASALSIVIGLVLLLVNTASAGQTQVDGSTGTITDAASYYPQLSMANNLASLGSLLIIAGVLGIIIVLATHSLRSAVGTSAASILGSYESDIDFTAFVDDDDEDDDDDFEEEKTLKAPARKAPVKKA